MVRFDRNEEWRAKSFPKKPKEIHFSQVCGWISDLSI
jgi:hypothetical protein